jgi:hypothetical protein
MADFSRLDRIVAGLEQLQREANDILDSYVDELLHRYPPGTTFGHVKVLELARPAGSTINYAEALKLVRRKYSHD